MTDLLNYHQIGTCYAYTETIEKSLMDPPQWRKIRTNSPTCSGQRYLYGPWRDTREQAESDTALSS